MDESQENREVSSQGRIQRYRNGWKVLKEIKFSDLSKKDESSNLPLLLMAVIGCLAAFLLVVFELYRLLS